MAILRSAPVGAHQRRVLTRRPAVIPHSPTVVADTRRESWMAHSSSNGADWRVRAQVGMPVPCSDGHFLGAVEVMDRRPRRWSSPTVQHLGSLARMAEAHLGLRLVLRGT